MTVQDDRWLLPEGVEEVLPPMAGRLERRRRQLIDLYSSWGYRLVIPPFIEYLESLLTGTGRDLDLQTFKLIDQLSGRMMGVRADMTPQVARIDAHHLKSDAPERLCYLGTVLHTLPDGFSGNRSPVQVGAELYGHAGIEADCEVLMLMLETLEVAGVEDVHLDLGHVGIFRGLARLACLDEPAERALHDALQRKATPEIMALLSSPPVSVSARGMIEALVRLNGDETVLVQARADFAGADESVLRALGELEQLAELMKSCRPDVRLHFDLAELSGYNYHTGVVFAAFVAGHGQEVARGGRYDHIGEVFGRARPATGFSTDLKSLDSLAKSSVDERPSGVLAPWASSVALHKAVQALREHGERVVYDLPGSQSDPESLGCNRVLKQSGAKWVVIDLNSID